MFKRGRLHNFTNNLFHQLGLGFELDIHLLKFFFDNFTAPMSANTLYTDFSFSVGYSGLKDCS